MSTPDEVFSSKGRTRILMILVENEELNISAIAEKARLNYTSTYAHLNALEASGIVRCKRFGRIKVYLFADNKKANLYKNFLREAMS